jgi:hypothetical protein
LQESARPNQTLTSRTGKRNQSHDKSRSDILFRSKKAKIATSAGQSNNATASSSKFYKSTRITKPKGLIDEWRAKLNPHQIVPPLRPYKSIASFASSLPEAGPSQPLTKNISKRHDLEIISVDYISDSEPVGKSSKQVCNSPELSFGHPPPPSQRRLRSQVCSCTLMYAKCSN